MELAFEVFQCVVVAGSLALAVAALKRAQHEHAPDRVHVPVRIDESEEPRRAEVSYHPTVSPRKFPGMKRAAPPVCECGAPGTRCRLHSPEVNRGR